MQLIAYFGFDYVILISNWATPCISNGCRASSLSKMFRIRTALQCIGPIQRTIRYRQHIISGLQCTSYHTSIAIRQENEPHGPSMDELPKAPIINPADKYKEDGERLHEYGTYLLTCLPKFIQKFR